MIGKLIRTPVSFLEQCFKSTIKIMMGVNKGDGVFAFKGKGVVEMLVLLG